MNSGMDHLVDIGLWQQRLTNGSFFGRPALFLDRDGVIVEEVHFLDEPENVRLTPGVVEAIAAANSRQVPVIVITNQSGIARGRFGWVEFEAVQNEIVRQLHTGGAFIDLVLACGYHPDGHGALAREHPWRKPNPGMLQEAAKALDISLPNSIVIGDRFTDLAAGKAAGLRRGALVKTGYGAAEIIEKRKLALKWSQEAVFLMRHEPTAAIAISRWLDTL